MHTRRFGRLGWQVSEIGYGMWGMAGWSGSDDAESLASLDAAVAHGVTFFDTAFAYGDGRSEGLLAQTLQRHADRRLYVATKVPPKNRVWPGTADTPVSDVFPYDYIVEMTDRSLRNLGVERLDLQQLHVWSDAWASDDGWRRAAEDLKRQGKIEGFGISVNRWEPANVLQALDTGLVDAVQVVYNIFDQAPEDELFPAAERLDVAIIARVPFDEGSLTGTMTADMTWPEGDWRNLYFTPENLRGSTRCARSCPRACRSLNSRSASSSSTRRWRRRFPACASCTTWRRTPRCQTGCASRPLRCRRCAHIAGTGRT
jgi:aryl-alcohol dehydrogenase-like predicted oxidoreductase